MKKIGFIDLFIDEYHANNYPEWIRKTNRGYDVGLAWEEYSKEGMKNLQSWCDELNVTAASSIEQVVEESDCIVVLAPSNPEVHERLAELPLKSGKPVYVDKPFAPDRQTAERIFSLAKDYKTPLMSSSALRFGSQLQNVVNDTHKDCSASFASIRGGGSSFWEYSIHQLEMMVMLMGTGATQVMQCGANGTEHMLVDYKDGRRACMTLNGAQGFALSAFYQDKDPVVINSMDGFWEGFIDSLLNFFDTGCPCVPEEQTMEIISLVETGIKALEKKDQWVSV
jgi:predicted dehydrogenase